MQTAGPAGIASEDELDAEFEEWIREAYEYGEQKHLMEG